MPGENDTLTKVTPDEILASVGAGSPRAVQAKLTGLQQVGFYLAIGVGSLIFLVTLPSA